MKLLVLCAIMMTCIFSKSFMERKRLRRRVKRGNASMMGAGPDVTIHSLYVAGCMFEPVHVLKDEEGDQIDDSMCLYQVSSIQGDATMAKCKAIPGVLALKEDAEDAAGNQNGNSTSKSMMTDFFAHPDQQTLMLDRADFFLGPLRDVATNKIIPDSKNNNLLINIIADQCDTSANKINRINAEGLYMIFYEVVESKGDIVKNSMDAVTNAIGTGLSNMLSAAGVRLKDSRKILNQQSKDIERIMKTRPIRINKKILAQLIKFMRSKNRKLKNKKKNKKHRKHHLKE